jgi:hypothetical protein
VPANEQADFLLGPNGGPKPFMLVRPVSDEVAPLFGGNR